MATMDAAAVQQPMDPVAGIVAVPSPGGPTAGDRTPSDDVTTTGDVDGDLEMLPEAAAAPDERERRKKRPANAEPEAEAEEEIPGTGAAPSKRPRPSDTEEDVTMIVPDSSEETERDDKANTPLASPQTQQDQQQQEEEAVKETTAPVLGEIPEGFYDDLKAGTEVDVFCIGTKQWLAAKLESVNEGGYRVHYMGWNKKTDENILAASRMRIAPRGRHAPEAWAKNDARVSKAKQSRAMAITTQAHDANMAQILATSEPASFVEAGATRSGRRITKRVLNTTPVKRKPTVTTPSKKKSAEECAREAQEDNLCGVCGEYEDDALTDMVFCDGGCLNSYHLSCLGLDAVPEEEEWLCEQCRTNEQECFACGRNDTIGAKGGVFRCSIPSCGKFYHQSCIDANKHARRHGRVKTTNGANGNAVGSSDAPESAEDGERDFDAPFRCPRHVCSVCENTKKSKAGELMFCLKCPESYHPFCVPPSARYNNLGLLCWRHPNDKLPRIPTQYLVDPTFDSVTVDSKLTLPSLYLPKNEPRAEDIRDCHHFRLQLDLMEVVKQQPPTYRTLVKNIYTFKQTKESLEDVPVCICKKACDDNCINRLSFTECFGPAPTPGVPFNRSDKNKESNCPLGEQCGNRALHQRLYPRFERFHTAEKGWGLRVLEPVKAGQLVIEYVGEVINEEEKDRRLNEHARLHPEDKNMYIMELSNGVYIDARHKGSVSRFINHSCDPNCCLLKWNVRGVNRIGITACKDIAAGEELSYDYQFHTSQALEWRCYCKAKSCRGTMAPEKLNMENDASRSAGRVKLSKKELAKKMKRAMVIEKIQQEKEEKATSRRLNATAQISRTIGRTGPASRELKWASFYRVFLARNAIRGFDFLQRKAMLDKRIAANAQGKTIYRNDDTASTASANEDSDGVPAPPSTMRLKVVSKRDIADSPMKSETVDSNSK